MEKICILGLGYVGLTLAVHAAGAGFEVYGVEISDETRDIISEGRAPFHEPGIDNLIQQFLDERLFISERVPENIEFSVIIVSVGTPLMRGSIPAPNLDILAQCIEDIATVVNENALVVLRSTVPVGTTRQVEKEILEKTALESINIAFCPERTAEGNALYELQHLPQVISGNTPHAEEKSREFFLQLANETILASSLEEAEITKLFNNVYRDSIFALANTFSHIAQEFGVDGRCAIENANYNYSRSNIPIPGFVAGPCLEKDAYILTSNMSDDVLKNNILSSREMNQKIEVDLGEWLNKCLCSSEYQGLILITGLAFKGRPATNDLRGSSSIRILDRLKKFNSRIHCHDHENTKEQLSKHLNFNCLPNDFYRGKHKCKYDLIIILNNHASYTSEPFHDFVNEQTLAGAKIFDAWGVLENDHNLTLTNYRIDKI